MTYKKYIIAPAGHGKTEQIANFILDNDDVKKLLVLTHTNAGVSSLIKRFRKKKISSDKYDIYTIDSFAIKYSKAYPCTSEVYENPTNSAEYDQCRKGAIKVFNIEFLQNFLQKRYSLIIVDEYQDCSDIQHELISKISENTNCIILGDPMQGIFDFGGCNIVNWATIRKDFEKHEIELDIPHRWRGDNEKLGQWIKETRKKIENGEEIIFEGSHIDFLDISTTTDKVNPIFKYIEESKEILILIKDDSSLGSFKKELAKYFRGIIQVVDALDFSLLYKFLKNIIINQDELFFNELISFCKNCMTQVGHFESPINRKVQKIWDETNPSSILELRNKKINVKDPLKHTKINKLYCRFLDVIALKEVERAKHLILLMDEIEKFIKEYDSVKKGYIYRKDIWNSVKNALSMYVNKNEDMESCGRKIRQKTSFVGRGFKKVIGTTLLTKGLEYEHVIIDDPSAYDAKHLYVALSRATKKITIFGKNKKIIVEKPSNL